MDREHVLNSLEAIGAGMSNSTFNRYGVYRLIPRPSVKRLGHGAITKFPERCIFEAAAANWLLNHTLTGLGWPEDSMVVDKAATGGRIVKLPRRRISVRDVQAARGYFYELTEEEQAEVLGDAGAVVLPGKDELDKELDGEDFFKLVLVNLWVDACRRARKRYQERVLKEFDELKRERAQTVQCSSELMANLH